MTDNEILRQRMVDNQIRTRDVTDRELIQAFLNVPRERFVSGVQQPFAYSDLDLPLESPGRVLLNPALMGRIIQAMEITPKEVVLDLGCGRGYASALMARLAEAVVAVEPDEELRHAAEANMVSLKIDNVAIVEGSLTEGYPSEGPYDAILIAGGIEVIPPAIFEQLSEYGRLAAIEMNSEAGRVMLYSRVGTNVSGRPVLDASAPIIPGFERKREFVF